MDIQSLYQRWYDDMITDAFHCDNPQTVTQDKFQQSFGIEADILYNEGINPYTLDVDDIADDYQGDVFTPEEFVYLVKHFLAS